MYAITWRSECRYASTARGAIAVKAMQRKKTIRICWVTVGKSNVMEEKISYPIFNIVEPFEKRKHIASCTSEEAARKKEAP